ncbi:NAD(P)H-binding protein [Bacillus sp. CMF12]|uniref:NAD(P)H-binding protein n=1 Tax=Bacillaceae TaxID=186817 RepID=UPI001FB4BAA8|nr:MULTISPECIES: NAD(P)H-binding protein [Bacillaceae]UOE56169.1 NAD(P)H-binding protein [Cytobacillus oceanisediminis]USK50649.1 NAD(P)H-binding protein [Bacillus sp. CMF12]
MHALLIGATGATGKDLLDLLLEDDSFHQVDIFVRRDLHIQHEKLKVHVIDFDNSEQWKHLVKGDVLFSSLGTTLKAAGSKEAQWKIDYDYQYQFAKVARENNVSNYVLVSSGSSSPDSLFFYTRMKGQLEEAVKALGFPKLSIFKPPVLIRKNSDRTMEVAGLKTIQLFNKFGILRSQEPLPTEILAEAMINSAKTKDYGILTLEGKAIRECAGLNNID